jgi:hypothetical protein
MSEPQPCRKALVVQRACKEMGLCAAWEVSQMSESEYVLVWSDTGHHQMLSVRFSDHVLPDSHKYKDRRYDYDGNTFEVALTLRPRRGVWGLLPGHRMARADL